jgi:hypothetical protein
VVKVATSNQDRTISLKAAVCSCINKQNLGYRYRSVLISGPVALLSENKSPYQVSRRLGETPNTVQTLWIKEKFLVSTGI